MKNWKKCIVVLSATLLTPQATTFGQDRIFNYTYQSAVLGKSEREIEVWNTLRWGRSQFFRQFGHRIEFETGLGAHLQTSFYLNIQESSAKQTNAGASAFQNSNDLSFSNEWKYNVSDPFADPLGLALYGEVTIGSRAIELEPKLILDKTYGRLLLAFNVSGEFEFEKNIEPGGSEETEKETGMDISLAAAFELGNGVHLGLEAVNRNGFSRGSLEYSTLYAGPTLSCAFDGFWVNATFMPQLFSLTGATDGGLVLSAQQRYETRLIFSYAL